MLQILFALRRQELEIIYLKKRTWFETSFEDYSSWL